MTNIEKHKALCEELHSLYEKKNADYGNSFHKSFLEEGMAMPRIRLSDKLNRFKSITAKMEQKVSTESIRDTLIDLANYAIMTVMELDGDMVTDSSSLHEAALGGDEDNPLMIRCSDCSVTMDFRDILNSVVYCPLCGKKIKRIRSFNDADR